MDPFEWTPAHAVFVPELDAEHESLFHLVDSLQDEVLAGKDMGRVLKACRELIFETRKHFSSEERKMRAARYPSYEWHKQQHNAVRKRIKVYGPRIEAGDPEAAKTLLKFFADWLKDHTALTDRMMGAYLRNHERETIGAAERFSTA